MMLRKSRLSILLAAFVLVPAVALAAPPAKKKAPRAKHNVSRHWNGYGFIPGYEPADLASGHKTFLRKRHGPPYNYYGPYQEYVAYGPYVPYGPYSYGPAYLYRGRTMYSFGGPGFYGNRYNGGGLGPCYTQTPIGPIWNCGK